MLRSKVVNKNTSTFGEVTSGNGEQADDFLDGVVGLVIGGRGCKSPRIHPNPVNAPPPAMGEVVMFAEYFLFHDTNRETPGSMWSRKTSR